ncbi:DUF3261 domain-containing protein [Vibrio ziniensis]|uniref:DUF3261 domain-containing protein n=1 Tax=Vibrio ziniensis TaxID=2711221 RepID=A0A6G7CJ98_9VIBR|nr:DUF3261 domain-containing protein [Vibrio ziniensis]QIH42185.1 DUF3261 domain-containing protein [Vibrio ziniensis]
MKWLTTLLACLWLMGCSLQPQSSSTTVEIAQDVWVELPAPNALGQSLNATQLISAQWQDERGNTQTQQLPVQLQIDAQHVVLAGFSSWGTRLLSLDYDGENISTQVLSGLENTLPKPEQVLFNLMITLWPLSAWEAPLNKVRWSIIDDQHQRIIKNNTGESVLIISYDGETPLEGDIHFLNKPLNYSITIQTLNHHANLTTTE